jgi:hypothetical protein
MCKHGMEVWFVREHAKSGRKLHEMIDEAIRSHDKMILVLSPNSMSSARVQTELRRALKIERLENRQILVPIRIVDFEMIEQWESYDADTKKDAAVEVRAYWIADFSNWTDDQALEAAIKRLREDLRADVAPPSLAG